MRMSSAASGLSPSIDATNCYRFRRLPMPDKIAHFSDNVLRCSVIRTTGYRTDLADFRPANVRFSAFILSVSTQFGPG